MGFVAPLLGGAHIAGGLTTAVAANALGNYWSRRKYVEDAQSKQFGKLSSAAATKMQQRRRRPRFRRRKRLRFIRRRRVPFTWPRFRLVKFKVVSVNKGAGTTGTTVQQILFTANGLDDPHSDAGANLPLGLDQYATMYKKYCVVGSKHYVRVHNISSTGSIVYGLSLREPGVGTALTNPEQYMELPLTRSKILSPDMDHSGLGISFSAKRFFAVRKFMDAEQLHGTFSTTPANPTRVAYVSFWHGDLTKNTDANPDPYTMEYIMTSEYSVLLFDPIHPARSTL